jgi:hypothetical protein
VPAGQQPLAERLVLDEQQPAGVVDDDRAAGDVPAVEGAPGRDVRAGVQRVGQRLEVDGLLGVLLQVAPDRHAYFLRRDAHEAPSK